MRPFLLAALASLVLLSVVPTPVSAFHEDECAQLPADPLHVCDDVECLERAFQYFRWPRMFAERAVACKILA